jgi:multidrug resistance efflux pump
MATLLFLTYLVLCVGVFKLFRLKLNEWNATTSVLGGIAIVGGILALMNYNHPYTDEARTFFATTPILPTVQGRVTEVPVTANTPLKQGDVLFKIDPRPYEYAVAKSRAALAAAEQDVPELKASLDAAQATAVQAEATRDRTKQAYDRYLDGNAEARRAGRAEPFRDIDEQNLKGEYLAAEAAVTAATAQARRAKLTAEAQIGGTNTGVAEVQAMLRKAEYDLEQTVVRAPGDGYVTQVVLRPGMMTVPFPISPVMVFVNKDGGYFGAAFPQYVLQRVSAGDEAEIAFDAVPGRIFQGRVRTVLDTIPEGQLQPGGALVSAEDRSRLKGRALAVIEITDDLSAYRLPGGSAAQVALYSSHVAHVAVIRRILLRMKSWLNYLVF